ncbi:MAG: hypothetical protein HYU02_01995 [Thaumarchaeota archaeon]|nr:hypothetical protein [Nitrososphaerota archaeon]
MNKDETKITRSNLVLAKASLVFLNTMKERLDSPTDDTIVVKGAGLVK